MTENLGSSPSDLPLSSPGVNATESGRGGLRGIFFGSQGLRAGWRFAIFFVLIVGLQYLIIQRGSRLIPGVAELFRSVQQGGTLTPQFELIFESAAVLMVFLATGIMSRIEKRQLGAYGLPLEGAFGKLFWQGVIWGLVLETLEILGIFALGGYSFGGFALAGAALAKYAVLWAIGFVLVGIFEEFLFRGYAQYTLASGIGFWPAAFLLSAGFGAVHLSNPGEGWVGALAVFCFGMLGCLMLRRTGNLWFMVGFHAATDYAETFIYSTPDSGLLAEGHLLNSTFHGPRWLTGGTIGPEGSVLAFVMLGVGFLALNWAYPARRKVG
ncbi:MAG TPA: CPBP family intramembrane glutamic endopeptidase [Candidatus Acidoferrum sp.]|nr:CPBP family intramembrane glutamic endopeptidase [Candidatus Acidoferrum sp.]